MNRLLATFFTLLFFTQIQSSYSQVTETKWLEGTWLGEGYQPGALNQKTWDINLIYDYQKQDISINYPTFPCSGYWKLVNADKNKAEFIEYITEGQTLCVKEEKVIVTKINEEYITVSYFIAEYDGVAAFSTLRKNKAKK